MKTLSPTFFNRPLRNHSGPQIWAVSPLYDSFAVYSREDNHFRWWSKGTTISHKLSIPPEKVRGFSITSKYLFVVTQDGWYYSLHLIPLHGGKERDFLGLAYPIEGDITNVFWSPFLQEGREWGFISFGPNQHLVIHPNHRVGCGIDTQLSSADVFDIWGKGFGFRYPPQDEDLYPDGNTDIWLKQIHGNSFQEVPHPTFSKICASGDSFAIQTKDEDGDSLVILYKFKKVGFLKTHYEFHEIDRISFMRDIELVDLLQDSTLVTFNKDTRKYYIKRLTEALSQTLSSNYYGSTRLGGYIYENVDSFIGVVEPNQWLGTCLQAETTFAVPKTRTELFFAQEHEQGQIVLLSDARTWNVFHVNRTGKVPSGGYIP